MISNELFIFSVASTVAIGAVAYLRSLDSNGQYHVGFVMGKSKLAPHPAQTIPWLELRVAVLAVEMYELIRDELDMKIDNVKFSQTVVLCWGKYTTPPRDSTCM